MNCRAGLEYDPPPPTDSHLLSQLQAQVHRCLPQNPLHFRPLREWNMFLHQLPQGWEVPGHGPSTPRSPGQTYETDLPQVKSARFPGRPLVAPGQSHAHRAPPTDIEAPPCSAYVPHTGNAWPTSGRRPSWVRDSDHLWEKPGCGSRALAPSLPRGGHLGNHRAPGSLERERGPALPTVAEPQASQLTLELTPRHLSTSEEELRN